MTDKQTDGQTSRDTINRIALHGKIKQIIYNWLYRLSNARQLLVEEMFFFEEPITVITY